MACKTCTHTMQTLGTVESGHRYFWCSRCGTLKVEKGDYELWDVPRAWTRALKVLRRLVKYDEQLITLASGTEDQKSEAIARLTKGEADTHLSPIAADADKILRDCDPERRKQTEQPV